MCGLESVRELQFKFWLASIFTSQATTTLLPIKICSKERVCAATSLLRPACASLITKMLEGAGLRREHYHWYGVWVLAGCGQQVKHA
jgi:hypothetical protein